MDIVQQFFSEKMAAVIQTIPVSKHGGEDFASWPYARFGVYTVRSAYNLARTEKFFTFCGHRNQGGNSDLSNQEKQWKSVWEVVCPNKMKIVLWRMINGYLPIRQQLVHRHILAEDSCVFCGRTEHVEHLFVICPYALAIWASLKENVHMKLAKKSFVQCEAMYI
jgi:hypothetical protein